MPIDVEIIRAIEFIRVGATGQFDLAASKTALATLADACRKRGLHNAVLDLRELQPGPTPVFTPKDLFELVKTFPEVGFSKRLHLGIVYRSDPHKRARLFSFLSALHGWSVRAFGTFEAALLWLSEHEESRAKHRPVLKEQSIPIHVHGRGPAPSKPTARGLTRRGRSHLRGRSGPAAPMDSP
jgi:hypothetical protein